jgi:hypothetical protein
MDGPRRSLAEDRLLFQHHTLDRLLEISEEWIRGARGVTREGAAEGDTTEDRDRAMAVAEEMVRRAERTLELAVERMAADPRRRGADPRRRGADPRRRGG